MRNCPKCGFVNNDEANFCQQCGSRLVEKDLSETTITYAPGLDEEADESTPAEAVHASPVLVIRSGGGREGEKAVLDTELLTIGRDPENHLFLDDVSVSRHHARVIRDAVGYVIEDLNSLNGTYVNRKRLERHHLSDSDELQIGKFKLGFLEPAE
ncbi:MAG TPA: FHA domain-containing protein [Thermoleophilia bacterium]|nr:FHA domain-containing protein [Thermoleophilia bacterium]